MNENEISERLDYLTETTLLQNKALRQMFTILEILGVSLETCNNSFEEYSTTVTTQLNGISFDETS